MPTSTGFRNQRYLHGTVGKSFDMVAIHLMHKEDLYVIPKFDVGNKMVSRCIF